MIRRYRTKINLRIIRQYTYTILNELVDGSQLISTIRLFSDSIYYDTKCENVHFETRIETINGVLFKDLYFNYPVSHT